jgi:glycosyltransferase 2 family protein
MKLKPLLRWLVVGGTLAFLAMVLHRNWQAVLAIRLDAAAWASLTLALGLTLLAHICGGWVWSQMLRREFGQPVQRVVLIQGYLQSTIAKYLPGNVWHYYGRIKAATGAGASLETATLSTLLEPVLMAVAALGVILLCSGAIAPQMLAAYGPWAIAAQIASLILLLLCLHPRCLNGLLHLAAKLKRGQTGDLATPTLQIRRYPVAPLLGELGFVLLRGAGFLWVVQAFIPVQLAQLPLLLSVFSLAWVLGLVVPGAPGGVGVFEATAIALLQHAFAVNLLLGIVACYRFISVAAEALGAGLSRLDQQR